MPIANRKVIVSFDDGTEETVELRAQTGENALSRALFDAYRYRDAIAQQHRLGDVPPEGLRLVVGARLAQEPRFTVRRQLRAVGYVVKAMRGDIARSHDVTEMLEEVRNSLNVIEEVLAGDLGGLPQHWEEDSDA